MSNTQRCKPVRMYECSCGKKWFSVLGVLWCEDKHKEENA